MASTTRQDIVDAATILFAQRGLHGTTVRDLTRAAGVNLAAINYHFGDKASLYAEVLAHAYATLSPRPMPRLQDSTDAATALRAWTWWYLDRLVCSDAQIVERLMMHERSNPTGALETLAQQGMQPVFDALCSIVRGCAPTGCAEAAIARHALSEIGQCLLYRGSTGLLDQIEGVPEMDVEAVVDHIAAASLAAIEHAMDVVP